MNLWQYNRKDVEITLKDGKKVSGFVEDFCESFDNAEEMESLLVDIKGESKEYFEDEILAIELI
ncbi:TPA: hypothetical protein U1W10_001609 [Streptococcus suis]|nr:hypothetical protein [Streptococcus suis]